MQINSDTPDPLARFLPAHCDARLISHYLSLLADSEFRLKQQCGQLQQEVQQLRQAAASQAAQPNTLTADPETPPQKQEQKPIKVSQQSFTPRQVDSDAVMANKAYERGLQLFNRNDLTQAIDFFAQASAWNHPDAENMLGECYYFAEQLEEALKWYEKAAQKNHAGALYSAGYMHYYGEGTRPNHRKAIDFLTRAATAGNADAKKLLKLLA